MAKKDDTKLIRIEFEKYGKAEAINVYAYAYKSYSAYRADALETVLNICKMSDCKLLSVKEEIIKL